MLQRVRDLKVQYAGGTLSDEDKRPSWPRSSSSARRSADIAAKTEFNGLKLLNGRLVHVHRRRQLGRHGRARRPRPFRVGHQRRRRPGAPGDRRCRDVQRSESSAAFNALDVDDIDDDDQERVVAPVRRSARSRTASSIASTTLRPTRRTWSRRRAGSATWTWPRDGQLHEAPDPAAGRHEHARAGQPGPAGRSLAPALGPT